MTIRSRHWLQTFAFVLLFGGLVSVQERPAAPDASKTANPELVAALANELNVTPQQAEGAAGTLFRVAKGRMPGGDWSRIETAVPGMDGLLKAAPDVPAGTAGAAATGVAGAMGKAAGGLGSAGAAFSKLGLKPEMVSTAVPVVTRYVTKMGGADVGSLLAGALK